MVSTKDADLATHVEPHREELRAYCYRMLGSVQDADDALQETLIGAWRGLDDFEGRSSLRSWLYRIATNACLRIIEQRQRRVLPSELSPPTAGVEVSPMVEGPLWLEPYPLSTDASFELEESVELAFVAALQHLPPNQRAVLVLREVLGFSAAETAALFDTSVASTNSALQRARESVAGRVPSMSQQATLKSLGDASQDALVTAYMNAWRSADVNALIALLTEDVRFTMPPIPSWYDGRDAVVRFFAERIFATPWHLTPLRASGQLAFACYQGGACSERAERAERIDFQLSAIHVVTLRGEKIREMTGFLDRAVHRIFSLPRAMSFSDSRALT